MKPLHSNSAPKAIGPYSQAIVSKGFVFVSGQLPLDTETGQIEAHDIKSQTRLVLSHIRSILSSAGLNLSHVVKMEVFLDSLDDFKDMNEIYSEFFAQKPQPARYAFEVAKLPKGAKVEMACTAAFPEEKV